MSEDLTIPATRDLLEGWCGPVDLETRGFGWLRGAKVDEDHVGYVHSGRLWCEALDRESLQYVRLDLSRAECRDRVCRVMAPMLLPGVQPRAVWWSAVFGPHPAWYLMLADSELGSWPAARLGADPNDDTRLPDGSRRVDAQALRAVWMEVCGE